MQKHHVVLIFIYEYMLIYHTLQIYIYMLSCVGRVHDLNFGKFKEVSSSSTTTSF